LYPQSSQNLAPSEGRGVLQSGQTSAFAEACDSGGDASAAMAIFAPHSEQKSLSMDEWPFGQVTVMQASFHA
jgi:hypothetical protein